MGETMIHKMIRALVADDNSVARDVVKSGISVHSTKRYIEIDAVANGADALALLQKKPIDIAFIDINMPGLEGPDVVSAMRGSKSEHCLTIAMSTSMNQKAEAVLRAYGAYHFLQKPFTPDQVAEIFETYMMMTTAYPILVVDDSATMRKLTRKVLENSRFAFDIGEADSAETALRVIAGGKYRLVLTDFNMPGADGLELAGAIRDLSSKIDVYMMSTNDTTYLERSAAFIGIAGFLKKPFGPSDIDTIMHKYLGLDDPSFGKVRDMFSFLARDNRSQAATA